ncbi:expressed unknown protein [Seminavis robusta]|uniref:VWFA domain-containing protein n=1 Tax=Seminavis robusta TaxID=568900 RepID=A0A9N8HCK7_9STRA|nr:expressed unknown protein [Seminavis robusta]|eukprot:Sro306_g113020.1 n/a (436) ;mRNA; r:38310-39617
MRISLISTTLHLFVLVSCLPEASAWDALNDACEWLGNVYNSYFVPKQSECQRLTLQECSCFEVLQTNSFRVKGQPVNAGDLKKGYRLAAKFYHTDKGGKNEDFYFVDACYSLFKEDAVNIEAYQVHLQKLEKRKHVEQWGEDKFRDRIDQLNEMMLTGALPKVIKTRTPPPGMDDPQIDRLFLVLDNSGSMFGGALEIGKEEVSLIEDRVERTPTEVHFIGSPSNVKFRFEDNPSVDDILAEWNAQGGGTQLWEYVFNVLLGNKRPPGAEIDEVVIITDGWDNGSKGAFSGIEGFNEMMTQLIANGIRLRISVLCIGNEDMCKVSQYRDLARSTGGTYSSIDTADEEPVRKERLRGFARHITASNAKRAQLDLEAKAEYEQDLIAGTATELTWYPGLKKLIADAAESGAHETNQAGKKAETEGVQKGSRLDTIMI